MRVRFVPRFAGGRKGLLALYPGPIAEAVITHGLEHQGWALWIDPEGHWRLSSLASQPAENAPAPSHIADVPGMEIDAISLCFNQNARRVICWERSQTCTISFINPGPPEHEQRVSWPGVDPLIFFDGLLRDMAGGAPTDIIVFYLSLDRRNVRWRMQVENYAIEHTWGTLPQPSSLDAIARFQHQIGLWFSTQGEPRGAGVLLSDPYPVLFDNSFALSVGIVSGTYIQVVVLSDPVARSATLTIAFHDGEYVLRTVGAGDAVTRSTTLTAALHSGVYALAPGGTIVQTDAIARSSTVTASLHGGEYVLRTVGGGEYAFGTTLTAGLTGGTYASG